MTTGDEVVSATIDLDFCETYKKTLFDFDYYRMPQYYSTDHGPARSGAASSGSRVRHRTSLHDRCDASYSDPESGRYIVRCVWRGRNARRSL